MKQPKERIRWLRVVVIGVLGGLLVTGASFMVLTIWSETEAAQSPVCCTTPADWGFAYEEVRIASRGETLAGWYLPSQHGAVVILLHSGGIHRMGVEREARALAKAGFGILMYDRRAHGESTGDLDSGGWRDVEDIPAVLAFLAGREDVDSRRIGIFGASIGGQVALRAAAEHPSIQAVMADGPSLCGTRDHLPIWQLPSEYWLRRLLVGVARPIFEVRLGMKQPPAVVDVIGKIAPRPVFLISTGGIEEKVVRRYFRFAGEPKTLWVISEAQHGGGFAARPREYRQQLVDFFRRSLGVSG